MSKRLLHSTVVSLAIAATGCSTYPGTFSGLSGPTPGTHPAVQPLSLSSLAKLGEGTRAGSGPSDPSRAPLGVSGVVMAPAHVVAAGGGNVVAAGGGNVIAAGGGNVVAAGGGNFAGTRRVLALDQQVAVVGAEVYLADLSGERLPETAATSTDAAGRFTLRGAPENTAYMVVARFRAPGGAGVTLTRLGHASRNSQDQVVSVATTLVSAAFAQRGNPASRFDPDTFDAAVTAVADRLSEATMPDLTRPEDVAAKAAAIAADTPAVRQAIDDPAPAGTSPTPAPEPLIDAPTGAVPPAPTGGHRGKSNGKGGGPSGPAAPHAPEAPAGAPAPIEAAPLTEPPVTEPATESAPESGAGQAEAPPQVTPEPPTASQAEPPASQPPQAGPDKDKKPKKEKNKGKGGKPS